MQIFSLKHSVSSNVGPCEILPCFNYIHFDFLYWKASELFCFSLLQYTKHRTNARKGNLRISRPYQPLTSPEFVRETHIIWSILFRKNLYFTLTRIHVKGFLVDCSSERDLAVKQAIIVLWKDIPTSHFP